MGLHYRMCWVLMLLSLVVGCATAPETESQPDARDANIKAVLSQPVNGAGEPQRCLRENDYRGFEALNERYILFEGRRNQLWINTLRSPCADLRYGDVLVVRQFSSMRLCETDTFRVADWFDWPWYRRWPWRWGAWHTSMTCMLGKFEPVTEEQLAEVRMLLRRR